jgi:hypothetical protein
MHLQSKMAVMEFEPCKPPGNPSYKNKWWTTRLVWPLIAAAIVRFALLAVSLARIGSDGIIRLDTSSYLIPGRNLLLHGCFCADGAPDLFRTPGYPFFLSVTSLPGLPAAAFANVILSVFSVILVWRLGRAVLNDDSIALGAAWLFAFEPIGVVNSVVLMSETLFLTLLLLSLERLAVFLRTRRLPLLAAGGLWLAAATFVRPAAYYLPPALALGFFLVLARVPGLRWKAPAVFLISVLPWLAAWQIRNRVETGYSGFSSISDFNLYFFSAADMIGRVEHRNLSEIRQGLGLQCALGCGMQAYLYQPYLALHPEQAGWNQGQRLAYMHTEAERVLRAHFGLYLHSCFESLVKTLIDPGARSFDALMSRDESRHIVYLLRRDGPLRGLIQFAKSEPGAAAEKTAFTVVMLGLYLLAGRGVFLAVRAARCDAMQSASLWLLLGTSLYFVAISAMAGGAGADSRYRLPVMPIVCIFAAVGFGAIKIAEQ